MQAARPLAVPVAAPKNQVASARIVVIDMLRGLALIMMLMTHSLWELSFNSAIYLGWRDPTYAEQLAPIRAIPPLLFAVLTFLKASPLIFVMLSGMSVALLEQARRKKSVAEAEITRFLIIRAGVLLFFDWGVLAWGNKGWKPFASGILTCTACTLILLAFLRRLPPRYLLGLGLAILMGTQVLYQVVPYPTEGNVLRSIFLYSDPLSPDFGFPVLGYLPMPLLGYLVARTILKQPEKLRRLSGQLAAVMFSLWFVISLVNVFGRIQHQVEWYIFVKHPPSLAFLLFNGAIGWTLMYGLCQIKQPEKVNALRWLQVLGQVSLVFFVAHRFVMEIFTKVLPLVGLPDEILAFLIPGCSVFVLYFICREYRKFRQRHSDSVLKYI